MYGDFKTCEACGKSKPRDQFWQDARRCRKCVARATGKRRSERVKQWKSRVKQEYGLSLTISERRVGHEYTEAHRAAERTVPKTARDTWSMLLGFYGVLAAPGSVFLLLLASALDVHLGLWGWLSLIASGVASLVVVGKLTAPRDAAVADLRSAILKDRLKDLEARLMEYLRFYTTSEWRELRKEMIRRDGRVCQRCGVRIGWRRDVTVDHIKPRSVFPLLALDSSNLQVLCRSCNSSKGASVEPEQ